jgi:hypothetical protein
VIHSSLLLGFCTIKPACTSQWMSISTNCRDENWSLEWRLSTYYSSFESQKSVIFSCRADDIAYSKSNGIKYDSTNGFDSWIATRAEGKNLILETASSFSVSFCSTRVKMRTLKWSRGSDPMCEFIRSAGYPTDYYESNVWSGCLQSDGSWFVDLYEYLSFLVVQYTQFWAYLCISLQWLF